MLVPKALPLGLNFMEWVSPSNRKLLLLRFVRDAAAGGDAASTSAESERRRRRRSSNPGYREEGEW